MGKNSEIIELPESLRKRIAEKYQEASSMCMKIQAERDIIVRSFVLGFLSSIPESENKHFDLSDDMSYLIKK